MSFCYPEDRTAGHLEAARTCGARLASLARALSYTTFKDQDVFRTDGQFADEVLNQFHKLYPGNLASGPQKRLVIQFAHELLPLLRDWRLDRIDSRRTLFDAPSVSPPALIQCLGLRSGSKERLRREKALLMELIRFTRRSKPSQPPTASTRPCRATSKTTMRQRFA